MNISVKLNRNNPKSPYFRLFSTILMIKNVSVPQIQNMVRADAFLRVPCLPAGRFGGRI